jgi:hypothetical protein
MPLMDPVCIVIAQNAAIVDIGEVWHDEGEIVTNDHIFFVDPDFLAKNSDSTPTSKPVS